MHTSVTPLLHEVGMLLEVVCLRVFQHHVSAFLEYSLLKNQSGYCRQQVQIISRIRVDEVILYVACLDELEYIAANEVEVLDA